MKSVRRRFEWSRPGLTGACVVACALVAVAPAGCGKKQPKDPEKAAEAAIRRHRYTVRGMLESLPTPQQDLVVRHESMPHFVGEGGVMGMNTMSMNFPTVPGIALEDLKAGDPVEMDFEVDFDLATGKLKSYRATALRPLPPDTVLDFTPLPTAPEADAPGAPAGAPAGGAAEPAPGPAPAPEPAAPHS